MSMWSIKEQTIQAQGHIFEFKTSEGGVMVLKVKRTSMTRTPPTGLMLCFIPDGDVMSTRIIPSSGAEEPAAAPAPGSDAPTLPGHGIPLES